ncbi:DUF4253 domain-containing protein [Streptomyces sp. XM83C]|uniref:DUF4253 domain-containing protein n=2 Tax=Streptomyces TaxID=1883 RepID=A0ABV5VCL5_9ACTN|nr:DUF4253 domain-containing protein [Streptomyces sp. XM83C]MCK1821604.1 DUF4253 domain-containing protein [Streptomyces sp. XM83C]
MLVRARNGYDVPALLNWLGACNYGITGAEHQAVLRYFHEEHGAELVTLEDQVLELLVTRRPRTPKSVALAALEHYAHCSDIVDQGVGNIEDLAASQLRRTGWCFWWDIGLTIEYVAHHDQAHRAPSPSPSCAPVSPGRGPSRSAATATAT